MAVIAGRNGHCRNDHILPPLVRDALYRFHHSLSIIKVPAITAHTELSLSFMPATQRVASKGTVMSGQLQVLMACTLWSE